MAKRDYSDYESDYSESEWNSNKYVILRIHRTVLEIRQAKRDGDINGAVRGLNHFYADISSKLVEKEKGIWEAIKVLKYQNIQIPIGESVVGFSVSEGRIWPLVDEIEIKLIELADKHGLWVSNKDDLEGL